MRGILRSRVHSAGFSLVEMMIAMVIALVALGATLALYLSSSQTARFQSAVQRVNENGRFAIDMISRSVRMSGYDPAGGASITGDSIKGTTGMSGVTLSSSKITFKSTGDTVATWYQGGKGSDGSDIRDCQGKVVGVSTIVTNQYSVTTDNELVCITASGSDDNDVVAIAEGVEDMLILYGIDTSSDGFANRYVDAGSVGTDWDKVVSMRITLLVNSVLSAVISPETICLGCVEFSGTNDLLVRAEFQSTIGIRN